MKQVELEIQKYLRTGGSLENLLARYAIKAKRHQAYSNLVLFKYNQIDSPFAERIVQECRGIILDEAYGWRVVSRAFDKFFNEGEPLAAPIDWSTARVQEKLDGSLCVLYHYAPRHLGAAWFGRWIVATSGTPDASGRIGMLQRVFSDLFWEAYGANSRLPTTVDYCFYFELTSPHNRVVVQHAETRLTLLGARHVATGIEVAPNVAAAMLEDQFPHVREFSLTDSAALASSFASMSPLVQEGYVVCDEQFRRIKVKHPGYVALHHAKDGLGVRAFVDIARSGETPEVIAAFPEFADQLSKTRDAYALLVSEVSADYDRLRAISIQRDFAVEALKTRCSAALFAVRAKKAPSVADYFRAAHVDQVMGLLGLRANSAPEDI